jgi:hypothetical protein
LLMFSSSFLSASSFMRSPSFGANVFLDFSPFSALG